MAVHSKIEWTDATFNPWVGCTKISPACDHCYAEGWAKRTGAPALWQGERRRTTAPYWRQPRKWDAMAQAAGKRAKVFAASLADIFDNQVPEGWRAELWALIAETPNLDWLLLTKRPQNITKMLPSPEIGAWGNGWPNVWLGTTAETQTEANQRIPHLLRVPAHLHFLSVEPLLGLVDLSRWLPGACDETRATVAWVICGGESGPGARPMHPDWARTLRDQCAAAGRAHGGDQPERRTGR
jgi:protein gp37